MRILYFASFRARIGTGEEERTPPDSVTNVAELLDWLGDQSPAHGAALANRDLVRVAVNQDYARLDDPVSQGDEVAIFPPVTGG